MRKPNSRYVAAKIIAQWLERGDFPDRLMTEVEHDRAFITELVYGVVRRKLTLEYILQKFVNRRPEDFILAVMEVGVYQLCFMDTVEDFAALNESVGAVKCSRHPDAIRASGMVNAVLRNVQEERDAILKNLARQPDEIRTSHPEQLIFRWQKQYGERDTRQLCEWNNVPPETILRVESTRISPTKFMKALEEANIDAKLHPYQCLETFVILPRGVPVFKVPGYDEGWFTVQDPATSASVELLDPIPGESVLDACAAPGGKTSMIAGMMEGEGELVAMDVHDDRLDTLADTVKRTGWDFIKIVKGDASRGFPTPGQTFDAVLLDVPCMNTGVLRRRADARWRFNRERIETLKKTQWKILTEMAKCVKPGGRLVYSTCSLEQEENEELVGHWVREHPEFRLAKAKRLFPPKSGTDGAYAALLRREK
ncbi:MAG: 16S rRNA (cytosine(967)-C(5))-methyltransferase RsmB [Kiritimatiellaceae bacterium]|nr:16S rRNA (cytosine(967)-C(5))-methyltransferase RsmB [Kiritimatiellaceae bacterium]